MDFLDVGFGGGIEHLSSDQRGSGEGNFVDLVGHGDGFSGFWAVPGDTVVHSGWESGFGEQSGDVDHGEWGDL